MPIACVHGFIVIPCMVLQGTPFMLKIRLNMRPSWRLDGLPLFPRVRCCRVPYSFGDLEMDLGK